MADEKLKTGITDLPYVEVPPVNIGGQTINATSGTIGGQKISLGQVEAGKGSGAIGTVSKKGEEYFYVGDATSALILLGQLRQKTGIDQYGIWIGTSGQYLKYTTADGLVIYGGGIQAGNIHIPDTDTTDDSFHVDDDGNLWIGCTKTAFTANPKNAKAYILKNGDAYFGNVEVNGTLKTTVFQKDVVSAVGGQLIVSNSDILDVDMTALDSCKLTIKGSTTLALNSILLIKDGVNEEWLRVTNVASAPEYTVTRDLASAYTADDNPAWAKGTAVVAMGLSDGASTYSGGWLRLLGAGTNAPYYSVFARNGVAYNAYNEACRLGNLNGIGGKTSDCYGLFLGDYASGKYLMYDDVSGNMIINGLLNGFSAFGGDGSDGALNVTSGTTTLNLDQVYNFSSINVSAGATLTFTGLNGGAFLNCSGACTIAGTIELRNMNDEEISRATMRDNLQSGSALPSFSYSVGGNGGTPGQDGGNGGTSTTASATPGAGGAGGTGTSSPTAGANGSGGNSQYGGGGGGGGGANNASGTAGSSTTNNNGANGGAGASRTVWASAGGGSGGGGGGGLNTGTGGNGGAGGTANTPGAGGNGGSSGPNGGSGGNGGAGGTACAESYGTLASPGGSGGNGGNGYVNGGNGGNGGNAATTGLTSAQGGQGGNGGYGRTGTGGTGGNGGTGATWEGVGRGGTGGSGGDGRTGGNGGVGGAGVDDRNTPTTPYVTGGNGGTGGNGKAGATTLIIHGKGNIDLTGATINAQGGNGGNGGNGGTASGSTNAQGGPGGTGGNGGNGADIVILTLGSISGASSATMNNQGGNGGNGGSGGTGTGPTGTAGTLGIDGNDGALIIAEIINM